MLPPYRHRHPVDWLKTGLDRAPTFSQGALYEIVSSLTVFRIKTHADEFLAALEGKEARMRKTEDGNTDEPDAERIREVTRDFILSAFATTLKGHGAAGFVAELFFVRRDSE